MSPETNASARPQFHERIARFERAWEAGQRPTIEEFLTETPVERTQLLRELVLTDLEHRLFAGDAVRLEEYLERFPELASDGEWLIELITAEFRCRQELGQQPTPAEYLNRFPRQRDQLLRTPLTGGDETAVHVDEDKNGLDGAALPATIGRYRVDSFLARGGMGEVVRVIDGDFDRPLALKVMQEKYRGREELEERFQREARVTGQLQHPGIPPVQEMGKLPDGRPYFIMKLVKGRDLLELLRERPGPDAQQSYYLGVFEQICRTVGYAHAQDVIHRDLKPANIMVGAFGEVQVMDWGLAKVLKRSARTGAAAPDAERGSPEQRELREDTADGLSAAGDVMGTPAYMAPEQARGEVETLDARCDVFGLGGILCHILTGKPPFTGASNHEIRQRAVRGDLTEANTRLDNCGADAALIALAMRCLAAEKEQRPADGSAVAEAVAAYGREMQERLKAAEIEAATQATRAEEEKKLAQAERKRRRTALALAAAVVVLVVGGSAAGIWYQTEKVRQDTEREMRGVSLNRDVAAALEEAEAILKKLHLQLDDPRRAPELLSDLEQWRGQLVLASAAEVQARRIAERDSDLLEPVTEKRLIDFKERLRLEDEAWALADKLDKVHLKADTIVDGKWTPRATADEYSTIFAAARLHVAEGDTKRLADRIVASPARFALVAGLDFWAQTSAKKEFLDRLLQIARQADPDPWRDRLRSVQVWTDLSQLQRLASEVNVQQQSPQALASLAMRLAVHEGNAAFLQKAVMYHPRDFWLYFFLGDFAADPAERAGWFRAALAVRPGSGIVHVNLGIALLKQQELKGAIDQFRKAIDLHPKFALAHFNLGLAFGDQKDLPNAITQFRKTIDLDPSFAPAHYSYGNALYDQKDLEGAMAQFRATIDLDPTNARAHHKLGDVLSDQKDLDGAIKQYHNAIKIDPKYAPAHYSLGNAFYARKDLQGAIDQFREAIKLDSKLVVAYNGLGSALSDQNDLEGAITQYRKAIELDSKYAPAHYNLGNALFYRKDMPGAITYFRKAIGLDPSNVSSYYNLGIALTYQKDLDGALAQYRNAIQRDPSFVPAYRNLSSVLIQQGQFNEALEVARRYAKLLPDNHPWQKAARQRLQECEKLLEMERKVGTYLNNGDLPETTQDVLAMIDLCRTYKQYHATAAGLYAGKINNTRTLAEDLERGHRFDAARSALLAASGHGRDPVNVNVEQQMALRKQAHAWLQADLAQWTKRLQERDVKALPGLLTRLPGWKYEPAFVAVRDSQKPGSLPKAEQADWLQLWSDLDQLLKKVAANVETIPFKGALTAKEPERVHEVKMSAGQIYLIDLGSDEFDTYLRLHDSQGKLLAENDDIAPDNLNSRLIFTASADGTYRVVATSYGNRGKGAYSLTVQSFREATK
jgi:eukaryotic-like serine/threonine-protein kinase